MQKYAMLGNAGGISWLEEPRFSAVSLTGRPYGVWTASPPRQRFKGSATPLPAHGEGARGEGSIEKEASPDGPDALVLARMRGLEEESQADERHAWLRAKRDAPDPAHLGQGRRFSPGKRGRNFHPEHLLQGRGMLHQDQHSAGADVEG